MLIVIYDDLRMISDVLCYHRKKNIVEEIESIMVPVQNGVHPRQFVSVIAKSFICH